MSATSTTTSSETVTVASKLPNGLICQIFRMEKVRYARPGGYDEVEEARYTGDSFEIKGCAHAVDRPPGAPIEAGYALTPGIPKKLWDLWLEQHKDSDMVKNHLVFAHQQGASVKSIAREHEKQMSGLEPMNPDGDYRNPKDPRTGVTVTREKGIEDV